MVGEVLSVIWIGGRKLAAEKAEAAVASSPPFMETEWFYPIWPF